ncbi:cupin domain-containing protein [Citromicrobium bathyomarinum]|uniref:cupin domain-containing protein n=1 Tax=Citromicrobium bathyomarinum TaxID=72174 RepID=UPI0031599F7E
MGESDTSEWPEGDGDDVEGAATMQFDALIAPVDRDTFIDRYFNRDMLYLPGEADRFAGLLDWSDLDYLLEHNRLEPPRLRLSRAGKLIDPSLYTRERRGARDLDAGATNMLLRQGATLVISYAEELLPSLRALADETEQLFGAHVNINIYAGWGTDNGFAPHFDHHDVLVLQARGRKRWRVADGDYTRPTTRYRNSPCPLPEKFGFDTILESGDVLYLPRGWWHEATPLGEESLHITVAISCPVARNVLDWLAPRIEQAAIGSAAVPPPSRPEARKAYFADLLRAIEAQFDGDISEDFARSREAERPAAPRFNLAGMGESPPTIDRNTIITLASERRVDERRKDGAIECVIVGGREWPCHPPFLPALRLLRSYRGTSFGELAATLADPAQEKALQGFVQMLAAGGAVFLEPGE